MAVIDRHNELLEKPSGLIFFQAVLANNIFKHVTPRCILHDDAEILPRQEDLTKLHNVRVEEHSMVENLGLDVFRHLQTTHVRSSLL